MIELCCEYFSVRCIWLYVIMYEYIITYGQMHIIATYEFLSEYLLLKFAWMSRNALIEASAISEV